MSARKREREQRLLQGITFEVETIDEVAKFYGFTKEAAIIEDDLDEVRFVEDLNGRRRLDAEVLSLVAANAPSGPYLDIGTHHGRSAARIAVNAHGAPVYTVNIHPDQASQTGKHMTEILSVDDIGRFYRAKQLTNITQLYADTRTWKMPPAIDGIALVYVDGCHDRDYVYEDTRMILDRLTEGGFVLWHDFSPRYRVNHQWIDESMRGVARLVREKHITGPILNVKHSWIGIWRKPVETSR